jgi:hypothetical protein
MNAALRLGRRHALNAVTAALILQLAVDAFALERQGDFLEAAKLGRAMVEDFYLPALGLGMALVHFIQVAGEQRRLVAARTAADFHDATGAVRIGAAEGERQQFIPELLPGVDQFRQLGLR